MYGASSTIFGSININFTSCGFALYKILVKIALIHTLLPEPVAPAISPCGIFRISVTIGSPEISSPSATVSGDSLFVNTGLLKISRRNTGLLSLFGTSIPIALFPGIGASIRISFAAKLNLISSLKFVILFTFTPGSGCTSKRVTAGPCDTLITCAPT
ncbi:Uncharacterised protein [Streptococcus pneumoniae]|nr:Uncharacterised protein [Streptococcus pneumoniae]